MQILISRQKIEKKIGLLGKEISNLRLNNLVLLVVMKGGQYFGEKLSKEINPKPKLCKIGISSYVGTESGKLTLSKTPNKKDLVQKNVIIVEDIIDTGKTLNFLIPFLKKEYKVKSVRVASLLYKKDKATLRVDTEYYIGFKIKNVFVVGCGLDYKNKNRNLPDVCIYKEETPKAA